MLSAAVATAGAAVHLRPSAAVRIPIPTRPMKAMNSLALVTMSDQSIMCVVGSNGVGITLVDSHRMINPPDNAIPLQVNVELCTRQNAKAQAT